MELLQGKGIEKAFGDRAVLRGCDLSVHTNERVGLVGINGAGKSTLLRIISGAMEADFGTIVLPGSASATGKKVAFLDQNPVIPGNTVGEALDESIKWHGDLLERFEKASIENDAKVMDLCMAELDLAGWEVTHKIEAMAMKLQVPPRDRSIDKLSGGEKRRLALARVLLARPHLLVLDEPTNHLDSETIEWLQGFMMEWRGAILLVTHDRYLLEAVATRIVEVEDGICVSYNGSYGDYLIQKAEREAIQQRTQGARLSMIAREAEWASRSPAARSTKQKARLQRLDELKSVRNVKVRGEFSLSFQCGVPKGSTLLELRQVNKSFADRHLIDNLDLVIRPGDRLGILGPNGAGKSTLLNIIATLLEPDSGEIQRGPRVKLAMLDQDRSGLDPKASVFEAAGNGNPFVKIGDSEVHVVSFLNRLQFGRESLDQRVSSLSGGERARLLLAKVLLDGAGLILLDEPTNDLDLLTLRVLEEALLGFDGAVVVVSHDRAFLDRVCTAVLSYESEGEIVQYASRIQARDAYAKRLADEAKAARKANSSKPKAEKKPPTAATKAKRRSYKENTEYEKLPAEIDRLETDLTQACDLLADPKIYKADPDKVQALTALSKDLPNQIERLYARWEELDAMVE